MKKAHPEKSIRTLSYMCNGSGLNTFNICNNAIRMAGMKYRQKEAPAFLWYFTWQSPMLEDAGAWHTAELAFCFDNTKRCEQGTGNGPEAQALARKMALFARNILTYVSSKKRQITPPAPKRLVLTDNRGK